jgi:hypothetical protein
MKANMRPRAALFTVALTAVAALAALGLTTRQARAGCGPELRSDMTPAVYRKEGGAGQFLRTDFDEWRGPFTTAPITGLWKFVFTGQGNTGPAAMFNGAQIDAGFVTWHDDGTELMNSGRAPASGSFCMGVWKHVRGLTYRLNHWALSWIPDYHPGVSTWSFPLDEAPQPVGPTNIQETVTLDRSQDRYTGTFTLTQYQYDGTNVTDADPKKVAFVIVGVVSATRIEVD